MQQHYAFEIYYKKLKIPYLFHQYIITIAHTYHPYICICGSICGVFSLPNKVFSIFIICCINKWDVSVCCVKSNRAKIWKSNQANTSQYTHPPNELIVYWSEDDDDETEEGRWRRPINRRKRKTFKSGRCGRVYVHVYFYVCL